MTAFFPSSRLVMSGETTRSRKLIGRRLTVRRARQTIVGMGERDAFGREKGEDPLQEMGWQAGLADAPAEPPRPRPATRLQWQQPRPAPAPAAAAPTPVQWQQPSPEPAPTPAPLP